MPHEIIFIFHSKIGSGVNKADLGAELTIFVYTELSAQLIK